MPEAFLLTYLLFENSIWKSVIKLNLQIKLYKQSWIWDNMMSLEKKPVGKREFCSNQNGKYTYFKDKTRTFWDFFFFPLKAKYLMRGFFLPEDLSVFQTGVSSSDAHQYGGCLWGSTCPLKRGWWIGACSVLERKRLWGVMETNSDFSQWCMVGKWDCRENLIKERLRLDVRENIFSVVQRGDVSVLAYFQELVG